MNKLVKTSILVFLSFIFVNTIFAQKPKYNEQITITAPYEPSVSDANKISSEPGNISLEVEKDKLDYQTTKFNITTTNLNISGVSLPDFKYYDDVSQKHIFYSKLGFGTNLEPLAYVSLNTVESNKIGGGLKLKHHSALRQMDSVLNNMYSNSHISGYGRFNLNNQQLKLGAFYNHNLFHYHGIMLDSLSLDGTNTIELLKESTANDIKQLYQNIGGFIQLSNIKTLSFDYNTGINFTYTKDNYGLNDYEVVVPVNYSYYTNLFRKSTSESLNINFLAQYNYSLVKSYTENYCSNNYGISISPTYNVIGDRFNVTIGANFSVYSELFSDKESNEKYNNSIAKFAIHPIAEIKTYIIKDAFSFTVGVKGENYRNTINVLKAQNKYMAQSMQLIRYSLNNNINISPFKMTNILYDAYCSLDTRFGKFINFSLGANLSDINNLPIYHSFPTQYTFTENNSRQNFNVNKFNYVYDNIRQIGINAEFTLNTNNVLFTLNGNYFINNIKDIDNSDFLKLNIKPYTYNMPQFTSNASIIFKFLNNKLNFGLHGYVLGGVKDVDFSNTNQNTINHEYNIIDLPVMYDMGFLASYKITNNVSVWLNVNNMLHFNKNRLYLYYLYPEYTINGMLGISMSF